MEFCNFSAIVLRLRFYVKSILVLEAPKTTVLTLYQLYDCEFLTFIKCEKPKISKFKASKMVEMTVFDLLNSAKIDFT